MATSHLPSVPSAVGHIAILLHGNADKNSHGDSRSEEQVVRQLWKASREVGVKYLTLCGALSLDKKAADAVEKIMQEAKENTGTRLNFIPLETGRNEIIKAARIIAEDVGNGRLTTDQMTQELIGRRLDTAQLPDPDLIIITGGVKRLDNTLLWQAAYSEFVFLDEPWPNITPELFLAAIAEYHTRERRFGGLSAKAQKAG